MSVTYERKEHVSLITINRPETLNALDYDVLRDLDEAVGKAEDDSGVRVLIITGAGKAFVAGADLRLMKDFDPAQAKAFSEYGSRVFLKIESLSKPVIAAVNGYALGGGCELCLACDIRIAGQSAKFGQPETGLGVTPGFGGTQRLPRVVGASKAKELIFTAGIIGADEALRIGLVSLVVADDRLADVAFDMAAETAKNSPFAVSRSKAAVNTAGRADITAGCAFESQAFALCFSSDEQKNAMTAFVNKGKAR